jgi:hypothetical protein
MSDPDWQKLFGPIDVGVGAQPASEVPNTSVPSAHQPMPGILNRATSFASSMAQFAAGGFKTVSHEVYQARFAHCLPCEQYDVGMCKLCGCYLDAKVRLPHEECPEGKWKAAQ